MQKKTFYTTIIILLILLGGGAWYIFSSSGTPKTSDQGPASGTNLFPFGQGSSGSSSAAGSGSTSTSTTTVIDLGQLGAAAPRLRQVSNVPTAGAVVFDLGSSTLIRYVERATGHIYETLSDSTSANQVSNVTIPKVTQAIWSANAHNVILRYLDSDNQTIRTFAASVSTSSIDTAVQGGYLPNDIQDVSASSSKMFYLSEDMTGAQGIRANIDGSSKTDIFDSSFGNWTSVWTSNDILLYPKPTAALQGTTYILNPTTGAMTEILAGLPGLSGLLSSDEKYMLYSGTTNGSFGARIYDIKNATSQDLGVNTLAEKCVWSRIGKTIVYCAVPESPMAATYPDDWYKGKVSFADSLWKIDVSTGTTVDVFDSALQVGIPMDMINLSLDAKENVLLFTNKDDLTVWRYDLVTQAQ